MYKRQRINLAQAVFAQAVERRKGTYRVEAGLGGYGRHGLRRRIRKSEQYLSGYALTMRRKGYAE